MNLPLFLPDLAGLHRVAVTYFARFRMSLDECGPVMPSDALTLRDDARVFSLGPLRVGLSRNSAHDGSLTQLEQIQPG